jgi:uncharacterized protein YukE
MSRPLPRFAARFFLGSLIALQGIAVAPAFVGAADKGYAIDVAGKGDFVAQTNFVQCVGASMQMMLNMIGERDDRTAATQRTLQNLARELSGPSRSGRQRQGASVRGWSGGLNQLNAGPYRLVGTTTLEEALHLSAKAIRQTGKPVGLLVWRGRHAWVMSGFRATADPLTTDAFKVTAAIVLDPLYPHGSTVWGPSPKPREALTPTQVGRQFVPRRQGSMPGGTQGSGSAIMSALAGKYVLVLPYEITPVVRLSQRAV